jgi:hypothetical protein
MQSAEGTNQSLEQVLRELRGSYHLYSGTELRQLLETLDYPSEVSASVMADYTHVTHMYQLPSQRVIWGTVLTVILINGGLWLFSRAAPSSPVAHASGILLAAVCAGGCSYSLRCRPPHLPFLRHLLVGLLGTSILWGGFLIWAWWQTSAITFMRIYDMLVSLAHDYQ